MRVLFFNGKLLISFCFDKFMNNFDNMKSISKIYIKCVYMYILYLFFNTNKYITYYKCPPVGVSILLQMFF